MTLNDKGFVDEDDDNSASGRREAKELQDPPSDGLKNAPSQDSESSKFLLTMLRQREEELAALRIRLDTAQQTIQEQSIELATVRSQFDFAQQTKESEVKIAHLQAQAAAAERFQEESKKLKEAHNQQVMQMQSDFEKTLERLALNASSNHHPTGGGTSVDADSIANSITNSVASGPSANANNVIQPKPKMEQPKKLQEPDGLDESTVGTDALDIYQNDSVSTNQTKNTSTPMPVPPMDKKPAATPTAPAPVTNRPWNTDVAQETKAATATAASANPDWDVVEEEEGEDDDDVFTELPNKYKPVTTTQPRAHPPVAKPASDTFEPRVLGPGDDDDDISHHPGETPDEASLVQTVASSTYGEDRQKVSNQTLLDPYGDQGVYTGMILRSTGMPHGRGQMVYDEDGRIYDGDWRHGRWHGYGRASFSNGDSYEGEYKFDQRHGRGIYKWHDGRVYDGHFNEDKRHGQGVFTWPDGAVYDGAFVNGQREGHGKYTFADGGQYVGNWKDGRYDGFGTCVWEDKRRYEGEWRNGMAHGHGIETYPNGNIRHQGQWVDDEPPSQDSESSKFLLTMLRQREEELAALRIRLDTAQQTIQEQSIELATVRSQFDFAQQTKESEVKIAHLQAQAAAAERFQEESKKLKEAHNQQVMQMQSDFEKTLERLALNASSNHHPTGGGTSVDADSIANSITNSVASGPSANANNVIQPKPKMEQPKKLQEPDGLDESTVGTDALDIYQNDSVSTNQTKNTSTPMPVPPMDKKPAATPTAPAPVTNRPWNTDVAQETKAATATAASANPDWDVVEEEEGEDDDDVFTELPNKYKPVTTTQPRAHPPVAKPASDTFEPRVLGPGDDDDDISHHPGETPDEASLVQTVASSTYGEDRQKVSNQTLLDPYGDQGVYTGMILRSTGMPHGRGQMVYDEDGRIYDGDWRHGRWHGYGRASFSNGDSYEGEYKFDQRHGRGIYKWHDGRVYDGHFNEDKRHGQGVFTWPDGAVYDGAFVNGQREGHGKYTFADGGQYVGNWKDGRYDGFGTCVWEDKRRYEGEWRNGMAHGHGIETYPNGNIRHQGQWVDDEPVR
eukprot:Nitzschia sp. Nitz4//scaffold104_size75438//34677//39307//NITZ4_005658-RA/size75438-snap-gene-0.114-mRNA-1//1//CDS//3329532392//2347//frame0